MDKDFDSETMILATSVCDLIKRDAALYHGKLRCLPFDRGYGYSLRWGAETVALAKPCRVYGVPDQLGRIQPWGAGGFYFDRALVESIMTRIHEGEVPDVFECFINGSPDGFYSTAEEARAHALSYPSGFEWTIFKNGYFFEKGVIAE